MEFLLQLTILLAILSEGSFTTDEDVVTVTDYGPCIEGSNFTLTCKLKKRRSIVKWMDQNNVIPIIYCQINRHCILNPAYKGQYNYLYDPIKNEVDLIILKVDKTYNEKKLVCSDGTNFGCKILHIPEYEQSLEETESGIFTATSACSSSRNVAFKWIQINASSHQEEDFKPEILKRNSKKCSNECGITTRFTETISVAPSDNGRKYNLKMVVVYDTESIVSEQSDNLTKSEIEEQAADSKNEKTKNNLVYLLFLFAVTIPAAAVLFRKRLRKILPTFFRRDDDRTNTSQDREEYTAVVQDELTEQLAERGVRVPVENMNGNGDTITNTNQDRRKVFDSDKDVPINEIENITLETGGPTKIQNGNEDTWTNTIQDREEDLDATKKKAAAFLSSVLENRVEQDRKRNATE